MRASERSLTMFHTSTHLKCDSQIIICERHESCQEQINKSSVNKLGPENSESVDPETRETLGFLSHKGR